jgi:anti-anti-sigma factor
MEPADDATFALDHDGAGCWCLVVTGEIDLANRQQFSEALARLAGAAGHDLVADLTAVTFFGSTGVNALVVADQAVRRSGRTIRVLPSDRVRHVLAVTGLGDRFGCA